MQENMTAAAMRQGWWDILGVGLREKMSSGPYGLEDMFYERWPGADGAIQWAGPDRLLGLASPRNFRP